MIDGSLRLVERIHRRQETGRSLGRFPGVSLAELAELEARIQNLRATGHAATGIGLSPFVAVGEWSGVPCGVGGECVATDV